MRDHAGHRRSAPHHAAERPGDRHPAQGRRGRAPGRLGRDASPPRPASPRWATSTPTSPSSTRASGASRSACACRRTRAPICRDQDPARADRHAAARPRSRRVADVDFQAGPAQINRFEPQAPADHTRRSHGGVQLGDALNKVDSAADHEDTCRPALGRASQGQEQALQQLFARLPHRTSPAIADLSACWCCCSAASSNR